MTILESLFYLIGLMAVTKDLIDVFDLNNTIAIRIKGWEMAGKINVNKIMNEIKTGDMSSVASIEEDTNFIIKKEPNFKKKLFFFTLCFVSVYRSIYVSGNIVRNIFNLYVVDRISS